MKALTARLKGSAERGQGGELAVCYYTESSNPSGMGEHMLTLAAELVGYCQVSIVCPPSEEGLRLLMRAEALGVEAFALNNASGAADREQLSAFLRQREPDIFHIHAGIGWEGLSAGAIARQAGVPVVVRTEHLPYLLTEPEECARYAAALPAIDYLICVSEAVRDSFIAAGISPASTAVVHNGISLRSARHEKAAARARLGLGTVAPVFLTVARLTEQKGHSTLIDAVPTVLQHVPDSRFLLVGTGPLERTLRKMVWARGVAASVIFLGQREDVPDLMAAADALVLPSRFEGLPLVVLEAMAAGLPVIATEVCGTAEVIDHGETGILVPPDDPAALAAAMQRLLSRPAWGKYLSTRGRASVAQHFTAARMASTTVSIYRSLLDSSAQFTLPELALSSELVSL